MISRISATAAVRSFSDLLSRVRYRGETFVVERGGEPVCQIMPAPPRDVTVSDLVRLLESAPRPDAGYLKGVEAAIRHQPAIAKTAWDR